MVEAELAALLSRICACDPFRPDMWNICEPIDKQLVSTDELARSRSITISNNHWTRELLFFRKTTSPANMISLDLRLEPKQGTSAHNSVLYRIRGESPRNERILATQLVSLPHSCHLDYASVPDCNHDKERYRSLARSYSPAEFVTMLAKPRGSINPFGPFGALGDIHWFIFFGTTLIEHIGRSRLLDAGWFRCDETTDGLACYSTEHLGDADSRSRRNSIAANLAEFVWRYLFSDTSSNWRS